MSLGLWLVTMIQETGPAPLWPDHLMEWVAALSTIFFFLAAVFGLIFRMGKMKQKHDDDVSNLEDELEKLQEALTTELNKASRVIHDEINRRFEDQGRRIGSVEGSCSGYGAKLTTLEANYTVQGLQIETNTRVISGVEGQIDQLQKSYDTHLQSAATVENSIRERIAKVEERTKGL